MNAALDEPYVSKMLQEMGIAVTKRTTPEFTRAFVAAEMAKWQPLLRSAVKAN